MSIKHLTSTLALSALMCLVSLPTHAQLLNKMAKKAEGNYYGLLKHITLVQPTPETNGSAKTATDASIFDDKIGEAYLKGFINASYSESTDYDSNSSVNTFRQALGMNQVGTMTSKVSMYANRYNWRKTLDLFGAVEGYGAQTPSSE